MPSICVVPIFLVTDQQMPTGSIWNTASPINHRKLSMPAQNWLMSHKALVPFSNRYRLSMQFLKPRIKPPVMIAFNTSLFYKIIVKISYRIADDYLKLP